MEKDKRKVRRRPIRYKASVIFEPGERHTCVVSDISDAGARIDMDKADSAPEQFVLLLSHNGAARRLCNVVWRKPLQMGVKFEPHRADRIPPAHASPAQETKIEAAKPATPLVESVAVD